MMMKNTRPINLWELNPLDLAYQANSFTISELQLRVFQTNKFKKHTFIVYFHQFWSAWLDLNQRWLLAPKASRIDQTLDTGCEITKTRLTFEFSRFGFKFAVCVFQTMVDHRGVQPLLEQCKCSVLSDITNGPLKSWMLIVRHSN